MPKKPILTIHAIERFHDRVRPDLTYDGARDLMMHYRDIEDIVDAPPWPNVTYSGACGWLPLGDHEAVGVLVPHRRHKTPVIVTVLTPNVVVSKALARNPSFRIRGEVGSRP